MALTKITGDGYGVGTITTADNTTQLTLKSTDADGNSGPVLDLHRDSSSPADNDVLGLLNFKGENDASEIISYASINGYIKDATDGSEDGRVIHRVFKDGTNINLVDMKSDEVVFNEDAKDVDFRVEGDSMANLLVVDAGNNHVQLGNAAVQYRSDTNGLHIGKDTEGASTVGTSITASGFMTICRNAATVMSIARNGDDGGLINFLQGGSLEGGISVSGTTVSFTGGHLSRWSQLADNSKDTSILKGTVMTNLDQMAKWTKDGVTEDNEQLNCMAVSSVEGDVNVAGVFVRWDEDDEDYTNDMVVAMTGDMVIRIAKDMTVKRGNLLMSAGDGTAKPQGDSYVQDKTIAKVTSTTKSHTYDDGSYLVPCVLMAC